MTDSYFRKLFETNSKELDVLMEKFKSQANENAKSFIEKKE